MAYIIDMTNTFDTWRPHMRAAHVGAWAKFRDALGVRVGACPGVEWSNRLKKTAGLALLEEGKIRLSSPIFWQYPEGFILEIVPHELAHIAAFRAFGDEGHGSGWKQCMEILEIPAHRCWSSARMRTHRVNFWKDK